MGPRTSPVCVYHLKRAFLFTVISLLFFFFFELRFIDIIQFSSNFLSVLQKNQTPVCRSALPYPNTPLLATHPTPFPCFISSGSGFLESPGPFLSFGSPLLVSFLLVCSSHPFRYPCRLLLIFQGPVQPSSSWKSPPHSSFFCLVPIYTGSSLVLGLALPLTGTFSLSPGSLKERKLGMWSVPFKDTECELADIHSSVLCPKGQLDLGQAPSRLAFPPVGHGIYGKAVAFY